MPNVTMDRLERAVPRQLQGQAPAVASGKSVCLAMENRREPYWR